MKKQILAALVTLTGGLSFGSMAQAGHWVDLSSYETRIEYNYDLTNESRTFRSVTPRVDSGCAFEATAVWYETRQYDPYSRVHTITWLPLNPSMHKPEFVTPGSRELTANRVRVRYEIVQSGASRCWVEVDTSMAVARGM